jgi:hypothetical protein
MRKAILALTLTVISSAIVSAQPVPVDDLKKAEFFVGYSNGQVDTGIDSGNSAVDFFRDRANFNGFNVSGVYNFSRYIGVKGDVSGTYNSDRFTGEFDEVGIPFTVSFKNSNSFYNFVGGVQIKDNANEGRFKPFGHAMIGAAHARSKITEYTCTSDGGGCPTVVFPETFSDTGFSGVFGGGLDVRLNDRFQIRAIQVDYNPTRIDGNTSHNLRLGAGIVF